MIDKAFLKNVIQKIIQTGFGGNFQVNKNMV